MAGLINIDFQTLSILAPVGTGTILWFFIKAWMGSIRRDIAEAKQIAEKALLNIDEVEDDLSSKMEELKNMIQGVRLDMAEAGIKKTSEDLERLKEKSIKFEGQMQAAWRALENFGARDKRLSD